MPLRLPKSPPKCSSNSDLSVSDSSKGLIVHAEMVPDFVDDGFTNLFHDAFARIEASLMGSLENGNDVRHLSFPIPFASFGQGDSLIEAENIRVQASIARHHLMGVRLVLDGYHHVVQRFEKNARQRVDCVLDGGFEFVFGHLVH